MTRNKILNKYEEHGEQWQVDWFKRQFKKINQCESRELSKAKIGQGIEIEIFLSHNQNKTMAQRERHSAQSKMFNEMLSLDEFKGVY